MTDPIALEPRTQITDSDCALTAISMLLGESYRRVSEIARKVNPLVHETGLSVSMIRKVAKRLRAPLRPEPFTDLEGATGLLIVQRGRTEFHALVLFQGVLVNPADGMLWDRETFLATYGWKPVALEVLK